MWRAELLVLFVFSAGVVLGDAAPALAQSQPEKSRQEILDKLGLDKKRGTPAKPAEEEPKPETPAEPAEPAPPPAPGQDAPKTPGGAPAKPPTGFVGRVHEALVKACAACHQKSGPAAGTRLLLTGQARPDFDASRAFVQPGRPRTSALLSKGSGQLHGGGAVWATNSPPYRLVQEWITDGALFEAPKPASSEASGAAAPAPGTRRAPMRPALPVPVPVPVPVPAVPSVPAPPAEPASPAEPTPAAPPADAPAAAAGAAASPDYAEVVYPLLTKGCLSCHNPAGPAAPTRLKFSGSAQADAEVIRSFVDLGNPAASALLTKGAGTLHAGGPIYPLQSDASKTLLAWIEAGARTEPPPAPADAPLTTTEQSSPAAEVALPPPAAAGPAGPVPGVAAHASPAAFQGLPFDLHVNGRFDVNYERRGGGRDQTVIDGQGALRSYHQFLFLSRAAKDDPFGFSIEVIGLQFWEANLRHRFESAPLGLIVRAGKLLVPFGTEPLFHQAYGGLVGFDQTILPVVWAQEGLAEQLVWSTPIGLSVSSDLYVVRGHRLRAADGVLDLQSDLSPTDDVKLAFGHRLGLAYGPLTGYYSLYFNPLGFDRRLVLQAVDLGFGRLHGIPVLDRLALAGGILRGDVSGGGHGQDYYHFGSYVQVRAYAADFLYLQYRQGLRTFNNRRGVLWDETRLDGRDASTHTIGVVARYRGVSGGLHYLWNVEKADEVDDDFLRATVVYEF